MTWLTSLYRWFFPVPTYAWCVACAMTCRHWIVEEKRCFNGEPEGAGWFIWYIKCGSKEQAEELAKSLNEG